MTVWKAILLGLIQGLTEFLPVSSSGHLVIFTHLLGTSGVEQDLFLDVLLHLGTFVAVIAAFWRDVLALLAELFSTLRDLFSGRLRKVRPTPGRNYLYMLILSLLPLFLVLPVKGHIEALFERPLLVGVMLLVTGVLLFVSSRVRRGRIGMAETTAKDALTVGFAQLFAILPGISRSGATISAGLMTGFKRDYAVRYSFILSLPTTLAAALLQLYETIQAGALPENLAPYLLGMVVAAVVGYLAIGLVRVLVKGTSFRFFSFYCLVVGTATILYFGFIR
ncbi:MAG: undecaprenyl-diphosphate phosphatase [Clostridiales bacterium]|nr:undecaprenyl-diphosphate phosphatase [Clostridiales bacterium]